MTMLLGRFGDRRLEKGGPFFWAGSLKVAVASCAFANLAATGRERSV